MIFWIMDEFKSYQISYKRLGNLKMQIVLM